MHLKAVKNKYFRFQKGATKLYTVNFFGTTLSL